MDDVGVPPFAETGKHHVVEMVADMRLYPVIGSTGAMNFPVSHG